MGLETSPSGGSSAPSYAFPRWLYVPGGSTSPADGTFTADSETVADTTTIYVKQNAADGTNCYLLFNALYADPESGVSVPGLFVNIATGKLVCCEIDSVATGVPGDVFVFSGALSALSPRGETTWSGTYQISFTPYKPSLATVLEKAAITPFADGTYTVGLGVSTNGTITIVSGIITGVIEATP